jgi:hypothetical protein
MRVLHCDQRQRLDTCSAKPLRLSQARSASNACYRFAWSALASLGAMSHLRRLTLFGLDSCTCDSPPPRSMVALPQISTYITNLTLEVRWPARVQEFWTFEGRHCRCHDCDCGCSHAVRDMSTCSCRSMRWIIKQLFPWQTHCPAWRSCMCAWCLWRPLWSSTLLGCAISSSVVPNIRTV